MRFKKKKEIDFPLRGRSNYQEYYRETTNQAIEQQFEILSPNFPKLLKDFEEDYIKDKEGFSFSCKRHGDFLTVEITRLANEGIKKFAKTYNLSKINYLTLSLGKSVTCGGSMRFKCFNHTNEEGIRDVNVLLPIIPLAKPFETHPQAEYNELIRDASVLCNWDMILRYDTVPNPSKDDLVYLNGIDTAITVPHGLGQSVLDTILAELERGYEKKG